MADLLPARALIVTFAARKGCSLPVGMINHMCNTDKYNIRNLTKANKQHQSTSNAFATTKRAIIADNLYTL